MEPIISFIGRALKKIFPFTQMLSAISLWISIRTRMRRSKSLIDRASHLWSTPTSIMLTSSIRILTCPWLREILTISMRLPGKLVTTLEGKPLKSSWTMSRSRSLLRMDHQTVIWISDSEGTALWQMVGHKCSNLVWTTSSSPNCSRQLWMFVVMTKIEAHQWCSKMTVHSLRPQSTTLLTSLSMRLRTVHHTAKMAKSEARRLNFDCSRTIVI